jgi:hypothetical protein
VHSYVQTDVAVNQLSVDVGQLHTSFIAEIPGCAEMMMGQAVDGAERAYAIRHRVGVRVKDVYEVRKIDDNYFAE